MSSSRRLRAWIGPLLLSPLAAGLVWWSFPDPAFELLDRTLGETAYDRKALLDVLRWRPSVEGGNPHGLEFHACCDVQHLALVRLVELQDGAAAVPAEGGTSFDSPSAQIESEGPRIVVVVGTASLVPDFHDSADIAYYRANRFEFTPEGKLLSRTVYRQ